MSTTLFSVAFWKDATERALKTGAQAMALALGGGAIDALKLDWETLAGAGLGGILLSLLTSIGSAAYTDGGTASLTKAVEPAK